MTLIRLPAFRTLPSRMWSTLSVLPISANSTSFPRKKNDDVRPATFRPGMLASTLMISSASPSLKYSFSLSALMLANGSTATDGSRSIGFSGAVDGCSSADRTSAIV